MQKLKIGWQEMRVRGLRAEKAGGETRRELTRAARPRCRNYSIPAAGAVMALHSAILVPWTQHEATSAVAQNKHFPPAPQHARLQRQEPSPASTLGHGARENRRPPPHGALEGLPMIKSERRHVSR